MSPALRRAAGLALAAAVTAGVAALSSAPYAASGDEALLRLSWRTRSERVQSCRALSAEEQAALPPHMRRTEACEGRVLPYHLQVELDGRTVLDDTVHGGGARGDRPVFVFHELPLAGGAHRLRVRFVRLGGPADAAPAPEHRSAAPARLEWAGPAELRAGEVLLVTYDPDQGALVTRRPDPAR